MRESQEIRYELWQLQELDSPLTQHRRLPPSLQAARTPKVESKRVFQIPIPSTPPTSLATRRRVRRVKVLQKALKQRELLIPNDPRYNHRSCYFASLAPLQTDVFIATTSF